MTSGGSRRSPGFEHACLALAALALVLILVPQGFTAQDVPDGPERTGTVLLAVQTNEGLLASIVAVCVLLLCGQALLRKRPLGRIALLLVGLGLALATLGLGDLSADMPRTMEAGSVWCASDPADYYESDLIDDFRRISGGDGACMSVEGAPHALPAWVLVLAASALALAAVFWRAGWRRERRRASAAIAFGVTVCVLLVLSVASGLQHLE